MLTRDNSPLRIAVLAVIALLCGHIMAAEKAVTFKGHLTPVVKCTVNDGAPINVAFGNVNVATVDDARNKRTLPYTLKCVGTGSGSTVTMKLDASSPGSWDTKGMGTSIPGLDIRFLKDGTQQETGKAFAVSLSRLPELALQLEKQPGAADPVLRDFTATGTLTAEYQ